MRAINTSKNTIIAEDIKTAYGFYEGAKGLIGAEKPRALFFKTRWGIHTYGMKFPIDVIIFDDKNIIRAIKENLKPDAYFLWNPFYKNVLELPIGTITDTATKIGDRIEICQ